MKKIDAQIRISKVWFICGPIIFIVFLILQISGRFGKDSADAWQWLISQVLPTLTLISSVFIILSKAKKDGGELTTPYFFRLAFYGSIFFFVCLFGVVLSIPLGEIIDPEKSSYEFLDSMTIPLSAVLSIVTALVGIFFAKE